MFMLILEKAEEPEIKLPTSDGSLKKQKSSKKTCTSALLTVPKPLTVWTPHSKHVKRFKPGSNPNPAPAHDPAVWDPDFPLSSPFLPFPEGVHIPVPPPGT